MADPKVGRIEFGHATRDLRGDALAYLTDERYGASHQFTPTVTLSSRFVPEFIAHGDAPIDHAIAEIVNLAIRVGRGTATIKELSERLAPYGVRRKA